MKNFETIIIGAGAAGLMAAAKASETGASVCVLEHNDRVGRKILISGGGRCNFTNIKVTPDDFVSNGRHFVKGALRSYPPQKFIELVEKYNIAYFEKKLGQLFCQKSAKDIVELLKKECKKNNVTLALKETNLEVSYTSGLYFIESDINSYTCENLVIATGGLSISQIGASDLGYRVAKMFGHKIIPTRPALVPLTYQGYESLSGISLVVTLTVDKYSITEDMLFTHKGLSGPAILKASLYWSKGKSIKVNWLPNETLEKNSSKSLENYLALKLPKRFVENLLTSLDLSKDKKVSEISKKDWNKLIDKIHNDEIQPLGTEGYRKAEVTAGGVDTSKINSQTMESKLQKNLFFIGEVLDVTGLLGGYNFQWAWSSAYLAGTELSKRYSTISQLASTNQYQKQDLHPSV